MVRILRFAAVALLISAGASMAQTQAPAAPAWKGKGKMGGVLTDEAAKPVAGVTVKTFFLPGGGAPPTTGPVFTTNAKGEWKADNIADGIWSIEFWKEGFDPKEGKVQVGGKIAAPSIQLKMTKEGTDPIFAMRTGAAKAQAFFDQKKYSDSRAVYEDLLVRYPTVHQLRQLIARDYHLEKNYDKAIEQLQAYVKEVPSDHQAKLMLGGEMLDAGRYDDAWGVYSALDTTMLKEAQDLEAPGFTLLRANKFLEALKYFERVVQLYPGDPQAYYYRGLTFWQIGVRVEKAGTPEAKARFDAAKADLNKFMEMVPSTAATDANDPNYTNVGNAKKMLETIK